MHPNPTLYCDFTKNSQPIQAGITIAYSGGVNGTIFGPNGLIQAASAPRIDYDPGSVRVLNYLKFSEALGTAPWTTGQTGAASVPTVTNRADIAPDGSQSATKLSFGAVTGADSSFVRQLVTGLPDPVILQPSIWVKASRQAAIIMRQGNGAAGYQLIQVETFWKRLVISSGSNAGGQFNWDIGTNVNTGGPIDLLVWGAQLEPNAAPSTYTATLGSVVSSPPTPLGLLIEEARTNLCLQSEDFSTTWTVAQATVTVDQTTSPSGTNTADKIAETAIANTHSVKQTFTKAASALQYAFSCYLKAAERSIAWLSVDDGVNGNAYFFNLATGVVGSTAAFGTGFTAVSAIINPLPNGFYRCTILFTTTTGTTLNCSIATSTADGTQSYLGVAGSGIYAWGAQLEQAAAASSYIPTVAASVTRTADQPTTPVSNWFNPSQGTLLAKYIVKGLKNFNRVLSIDDGTNTNRLNILLTSAGATQFFSGPSLVAVNGDNISVNTPNKTAGTYDGVNLGCCTNGGTPGTPTPAAIPAGLSIVRFGDWHNLSQQLDGWLQTVVYYPFKISDAALKTITQ